MPIPLAGRLPIIVTYSHFSTRVAADRAREAHAAGTSMLMLMPPYHAASPPPQATLT
jgi:2-keto-3-deoxy-L-arabinonate dehydratase